MKRPAKTVFISYRRSDAIWALSIYDWLTHRGYDAFIDYEGLGSGDFSQALIENIRSRSHFLVLLTPNALDRCNIDGDWLRREVEEAMDCRRNVVPLMIEGFDFSAAHVVERLTGRLADLRKYNGVAMTAATLKDVMVKLDDRFLRAPLDEIPHPPSLQAEEVAREQQAAANQVIAGEAARSKAFAELTSQRIEQMGCPYCGSALSNFSFFRHPARDADGSMGERKNENAEFKCGYSLHNRRQASPCSQPSEANKPVMVNVPVSLSLHIQSSSRMTAGAGVEPMKPLEPGSIVFSSESKSS